MASPSSPPVYVLGVGLTKFIKPRNKVDYPLLALEASTKALLDAHLNYDTITAAIASYCYGDSACGQRCLYQLGMTGIPIYNVNNNCASGSSALHLARTLLSSPALQHSCILVLGFEKMAPGSLSSVWKDRANPIEKIGLKMAETRGYDGGVPGSAQMFGNAGREYMEKYGATREDFAEIARVNHLHSKQNPYSQFRDVYTLEEILGSQELFEPLTKLQACPTSDGAAAAVLCSEAFLEELVRKEGEGVRERAVQIAGMSMATDSPAAFGGSAMELVGYDMSRRAAEAALKEAGVKAMHPKVVELHDCFSANEMVTLEALGLCKRGKAHEMVRNGDITFGGRVVVNPSGGLISKGHPLGATGIAQCAELVWQLRGWANNRLVEGAEVALQHNLGLGGVAVVTVYKRADGGVSKHVVDEEVGKASGVGYNPAVVAKGFTKEQVKQVRSRKAPSEWAMGDAMEKAASRL
ncbi:uncharacterized protein KY384_006791 [Bacidia gigantensis]|uniref:uncharacterized protein n=1 Tax=Bacidia gigantensis TaxID=2732470 RepID=UPI001D05B77D|nr:uncharacterized protein KY384_006791 [Bacidia gigantensis]KAG8527875.1 hypothetical protein KY384_006791 [Bacidia gigantensis]